MRVISLKKRQVILWRIWKTEAVCQAVKENPNAIETVLRSSKYRGQMAVLDRLDRRDNSAERRAIERLLLSSRKGRKYSHDIFDSDIGYGLSTPAGALPHSRYTNDR